MENVTIFVKSWLCFILLGAGSASAMEEKESSLNLKELQFQEKTMFEPASVLTFNGHRFMVHKSFDPTTGSFGLLKDSHTFYYNQIFHKEDERLYCVRISPSYDFFVVAKKNVCRVIDVQSKLQLTFASSITKISFFSYKKGFVLGHENGDLSQVELFDNAPARSETLVKTHENAITSLTVAPDDSCIFSGDEIGQNYLRSKTDEVIKLPFNKTIRKCFMSSDAKALIFKHKGLKNQQFISVLDAQDFTSKTFENLGKLVALSSENLLITHNKGCLSFFDYNATPHYLSSSPLYHHILPEHTVEVRGNSSLKDEAAPYMVVTGTYKNVRFWRSFEDGIMSPMYSYVEVRKYFIPQK